MILSLIFCEYFVAISLSVHAHLLVSFVRLTIIRPGYGNFSICLLAN